MQYFAHVERVVDADTIDVSIKVLNFKNRKLTLHERVRIAEVDAAERFTEIGKVAKAELAEMIEGKEVFLIIEGEGKYGRLIAHVFYDDISIAQWIVDKGYGEPKFY